MTKPQIACQLIVFGQRNRDNLPATLRAVAEAGYAGYEGGKPGSMTVAELQELLGNLSIELAGVHTGYDGLTDLDDTLAFMKQMNAKLLMCSGVGDRDQGLAAYEQAAQVFNNIGRRCHDQGIQFCYHNHSWEFAEHDGVVALEWLYELTDPRYVHLCVDVYWVQHGGQLPAEFLKKYLDRVATVHFKDMGEDGSFAEIGQGILDWEAIMEVLSTKTDLEWIIVEQDRTQRTPEESIALSRNYIRDKLGL